MSGSVEVVLWLHEYELKALDKHLASNGTDVEKRMQEMLADLYSECVPFEERQAIQERINAEHAEAVADQMANTTWAAYHITGHGEDLYFKTSKADTLLTAAKRLRTYLTAEDNPQPATLAAVLKDRTEITQAEYDQLLDQRLQNTGQVEVLDISGGKALVLFTAKSDMEDVYSILSQKELPYKVLMQQSGSSQDQVLKEFRENTNSVLLGTGAYWEGISIEGKSLSNVVIFRLPFPVPDPIINYKASIADDALMDVNVPEMVIKLKQGIGRLIRNFTDTGIVCIIDRRLRDEPAERYHDIAWSSLPIKNRTKSLDELRRFYEGLSSANSETAK